jgi:hypothetical protein
MASKNMMNHYRLAEPGFGINTLKYLVLLGRYVRNRTILELGSGVMPSGFRRPACPSSPYA